MRIFYIYQINDFCKDLYNRYPYQLYSMLKDTYYTSKYNQPLAISSYDQLTQKFNKTFLHDFIFHKYKLNHYYHCKNNIHTLYNNREYSKLLVSSYSLKLKTSSNYPNFFQRLNEFENRIFVCDFENEDYFWLNKVINKGKVAIEG